jgi:hypothetical protein
MKIENPEMIANFGALGYNTKKMSSILGVPEIEIITELKNKDSEFSKLFQKGVDMSEYVIDLKLFNLAKNGDLAALKKFEERKKQRQLNEKRSNYLNQK